MVAIYHIWLGRISGGVDVFFVISGYFITKSLTKSGLVSYKSLSLYYVSTLKRVLPSAAIVISATCAAALFLMPTSLWYGNLIHAAASIAFLENWWLAYSGVDYLARELPPSPFQQLWALSVQMQIYLLLPLVLMMSGSAGLYLRNASRPQYALALSLCFFSSFVYALYVTQTEQTWAYFDTFARFWEFGAGGLIAVFSIPKIPKAIAKIVGWLSLVVMGGFGAVWDVSTSFPGAAAAIPVVSAAAFILASRDGANITILKHPISQYLGSISFSFYLWHWPFLIFYNYMTGYSIPTLQAGIGILVAATILAAFTTKLLEQPFRRSVNDSIFRSLAFCAALLIVPMAIFGIWGWSYQSHYTTSLLAATAGDPAKGEIGLIPSPLLARDDVAAAYNDGCHQSISRSAVIVCSYGSKNSEIVVALVGGSHSLQWLPALQELNARYPIKILSITKSECYLSMEIESARHRSCQEWNTSLLEALNEIRPDVVVTTATRAQYNREYVPDGYVSSWKALTALGIEVLAIRDNPWFPLDIPVCVELYGVNSDKCSLPRATALLESNPAAAVDLPNLRTVDFTDQFCTNVLCPPIMNGFLMYSDKHHITATYSRHLSKLLQNELLPLVH